MQANFWVCPRESASAAEARCIASGAYEKISGHHARGACVSRSATQNRFERRGILSPLSELTSETMHFGIGFPCPPPRKANAFLLCRAGRPAGGGGGGGTQFFLRGVFL